MAFFFPVARYAAPIEATQQTVRSELNLFPKTVAADVNDMTLADYTWPTERGFVSTWPLVALLIVCIALAAVSIAFYGNRVLQMRMAAFGFLLGVVYIFLVFIWAVDAYGKAYTAAAGAGEAAITYSVGTWAPVVGTVLMFLAQRAIRKDEERVRSADRLR